MEDYTAKEVPPITTTIVELFPRNIFDSLANGKIIPCLIFAMLVGIAVVVLSQTKAEKMEPFKKLISSLHEIIYYIVDLIIGLLPFAIVSLMARVISKSDMSILKPLLHVIVLTFISCFIHMYLTGGILIATIGKLNPFKFFGKILPVQITGFTTQSSVGTLPVYLESLIKKVGVSEQTANFVGSLGTTIGMAACAGICPTLLAVFAINSLGIEFGIGQYIFLIILTPLISLGTAGVPGGGMLTATALFLMLDLPIEIVAIFASIDAFVDMARTACNVSSSMVASTLVAQSEKLIDKNVFHKAKAESERKETSHCST